MAAVIVHQKGKNLLQPGKGPYMYILIWPEIEKGHCLSCERAFPKQPILNREEQGPTFTLP